jgi:hypothetical protein
MFPICLLFGMCLARKLDHARNSGSWGKLLNLAHYLSPVVHIRVKSSLGCFTVVVLKLLVFSSKT